MTDSENTFGGRYRIVDEVGRGGMGVIYRGIDSILDREVAIKVMSADFSETSDDARARFFREARAAARLQHRNIVTVFEFAEQDGVPYIVMEFLRGRSLAARLAAQPPMTLEQKLDVMTELCNGLQFAHENGVIHRDVKPANVWILDDGAVKLVDFGIAKMSASVMTMRGDVMGSAAYMSPEQIEGHDVTGRSDVFSATVMLYEMLALRRPFEGDSPTATMAHIVQVPPPPIESLVQGLPSELVAAISKGLEKNPDRRYQTAADFGADLQLIRMGLPRAEETVIVRAPAPPEPATTALKAEPLTSEVRVLTATTGASWVNKRNMLITAATVVLVAVVGYSLGGGARGPAPVSDPPTRTNTPPPPPPPTTGPFEIRTTPGGADIILNGKKAGVSAATVNVTVGDKVRLQRRGSEPHDFTITSADLNRRSGSYTLRQTEAPAVSVAVSITGAYPFEVRDGDKVYPESDHHQFTSQEGRSLRLYSAKNYLDYDLRVRRDTTGRMTTRAPDLGQIVLNGDNEKCTIYHNGRSLNIALKSRLPPMGPGTHTFTFVCTAGSTPRPLTVTLAPGQRIQRDAR